MAILPVSEESLARCLWSLFSDRNLAASALGVHCSAICSIADPLSFDLGNSKLLQRCMKVVFLDRPPAHPQVCETWDVHSVLSC